MPNFLHGVETIESLKGPRPITVVKSSVIGLIGLAPTGPVNTPIVVASDTDAAQFGAQLPGFTIPQALEAILKKGSCLAVVVNVFDPAVNKKDVASYALAAVSSRKTKTVDPPLSNFVLTDNAGTTTYVNGTDYTVDAFGNITILSSSIAEAAVLKAAYKTIDQTTITNSMIVGSVDGTTGARTGLKCFDLSFSTFGFKPKILIAPGFSNVTAIVTALASSAASLKAMYIADAPTGTTVATAIAGRGPSGTINFNTSDKRAILTYPMVKVSDPNPSNNGDLLDWFSSHLAGLMASVDNAEGYWVSPSNHEIVGITGVERVITASLTDTNAETNQLNAVGILTQFNAFGTGRRAWGNRSAAFPSSTAIDQFIPVRRTADIVEESIELAQLQFIDQPINLATIDAVRDSVNQFLRTLIGRGALIDGECIFDPADNPDTELAAGHVTYTYTMCPPPPMEKMTFKSVIDISLLKALTVQQ